MARDFNTVRQDGRGQPTTGSVAASRPEPQLLRLQRSIGNRATTRLLQRNGQGEVDIVDRSKTSWIFDKTGIAFSDYDRWILDFLFVQECMMDPALYRPALARLDEAVRKERRPDEQPGDDAPLDRVLAGHGANARN